MPAHSTAVLVRGPQSSGLVFVSSLIINLLSLAMPIVILQVYDRILPNRSVNTLVLLVIGLGGVLVIDALLRFGRAYILGWAAAKHEHRANCASVRSILTAPLADIERDTPGAHLVRLSSVQVLRGFHASDARMVMLDLPFAVLFVGLIWAIGGALVLVPVLLIMSLSLVGLVIGSQLRRALKQCATHDDRRYSFILEVLGRIPIVKSMAMEPLMQRRYERLQATQAGTSYHAALISGIAQGSSALFASIAIVSVVATGALMVGPGGLTLGELSACTLLTGRAMQPILRTLSLWNQFQSLSVAQDQLKTVLELSPAAEKLYPPIPDLTGTLELRNVTYRRDPDSDPILQDASFTISAGEMVAIKGEKGSGRSTLLGLMSGLLTPNSGKILINGEDITELDPMFLRQQISLVPNQPVLFQGTVLENLTMFRPEIPFSDVLRITEQLGLEDIIGGLPSGFDTHVGDGAEHDLPIGIAQLLVNARSLIRQPRILLFNEANSRLDQSADARLNEALARLRGHTTVVLISHRPSFIALADRVLTLTAGKILFADTSAPAPAIVPAKQAALSTPALQSA